jgi:hypothetical protein
MGRYAALGVLICFAFLMTNCGSSGPEGAKATKAVLSATSLVTWPNLCKRINVSFTDDTGMPARYGRADPLILMVTNAAVYDSNYCNGHPLSNVILGPDATNAVFWVNSTTVGSISITITSPLTTLLNLSNENPTADLVLGQSSFTTGDANPTGVAATSMNSPFAISRCAGKLLVSDTGNNRVLGWNATPTTLGQAADFVIGQGGPTTATAATSQTGMTSPEGLACDNNTLLVADYGNSRLLAFNPVPSSNGAAASFVWGQDNFTTGSDPSVTQTTDISAGLSVFQSALVASDPKWHRVLVWNSAPTAGSGPSAPIAAQEPNLVIGQAGFTTRGPAITAAGVDEPQNSRLSSDYLMVADSNNHRVLLYPRSNLSTGASAPIVLGQSDLSSNGPGNGASQLFYPSDVDYDGDHLIVADTGNCRMLIWNGYPTHSGAQADLIIGSGVFGPCLGTLAPDTGQYRQFTRDGSSMWVADYNNRVLRFPAP